MVKIFEKLRLGQLGRLPRESCAGVLPQAYVCPQGRPSGLVTSTGKWCSLGVFPAGPGVWLTVLRIVAGTAGRPSRRQARFNWVLDALQARSHDPGDRPGSFWVLRDGSCSPTERSISRNGGREREYPRDRQRDLPSSSAATVAPQTLVPVRVPTAWPSSGVGPTAPVRAFVTRDTVAASCGLARSPCARRRLANACWWPTPPWSAARFGNLLRTGRRERVQARRWLDSPTSRRHREPGPDDPSRSGDVRQTRVVPCPPARRAARLSGVRLRTVFYPAMPPSSQCARNGQRYAVRDARVQTLGVRYAWSHWGRRRASSRDWSPPRGFAAWWRRHSRLTTVERITISLERIWVTPNPPYVRWYGHSSRASAIHTTSTALAR